MKRTTTMIGPGVTKVRPPPASGRGALALHALASEHLLTGGYREALPVLCRLCLTLGPRHPALSGIYCTLAFVYSELGRHADARRAATSALRLDPRLSAARRILHASA